MPDGCYPIDSIKRILESSLGHIPLVKVRRPNMGKKNEKGTHAGPLVTSASLILMPLSNPKPREAPFLGSWDGVRSFGFLKEEAAWIENNGTG